MNDDRKREADMEEENGDRGRLFEGLSRRDERVLRLIIGDELRRVLKEMMDGDCLRPCSRMDSVESVVFGRSESNVMGLDERMRTVESFVNNIRRLTWLAAGGVVTGTVGLVFGLLSFAATR